ncbi:MAG: 2,3-bisphosphoglycerate-independent phosphoglycerate mutase, partial [Pseudomonadota bacterium]
MHPPKTIVLIVLDGWGHRVEITGNAIALAKTPHWHALMAQRAHTFLSGSGESVGLPDGQMGNSEVGHLTLGAGRVVDQDLPKITKALAAGHVANQVAFNTLCHDVQKDGALHLLALLSPGGVHSHEDHVLAFIDLAARQGVRDIYVHAILDGRDTPPKSAEASLRKMMAHFA